MFHPLCVLPALCALWFFSPFGESKSFFLWILRGGRQGDERRGSRERRDPFLKAPWEFCLPGSVGNGSLFPLAPRVLSLWPFLSLRAPRSLWLSILFSERGEVRKMDRESDMAEGDMGMRGSIGNIHPPLEGNRRGSRKDRRNHKKRGDRKRSQVR